MVDAIERVEALRAQIGHKQMKFAPKEVHRQGAKNRTNVQ